MGGHARATAAWDDVGEWEGSDGRRDEKKEEYSEYDISMIDVKAHNKFDGRRRGRGRGAHTPRKRGDSEG